MQQQPLPDSILTIPVPPNAQAVTTKQQGSVQSVIYETTDSPEVVLGWYKQQLEQQHWLFSDETPEIRHMRYIARGPAVLTVMNIIIEPLGAGRNKVIVVIKPEAAA